MAEETSPPSCSKWPGEELKKQQAIAGPLVLMNLSWFGKTVVTTIFLGRLGNLPLAGGALGYTFANVTGFSVLTGLCYAMDPICGQAFGARNYGIMRRTLFMAVILLLLVSIPISLLWFHVDKIMEFFGISADIASLSKIFVLYLLPDLVVTSFLCPLKAYLSCQAVTLPILITTVVALALHVPAGFYLSQTKGLRGLSTAVWLTDLALVLMLAAYVYFHDKRKCTFSGDGGYRHEEEEDRRTWSQNWTDCVRLIRLSVPCCLTTCLEWWCYEILLLLSGRLDNARVPVAVLTIVFNFDYILYSFMLSLSTVVSVRVSNELGAARPETARGSARVCLSVSVILGCIGGSLMAISGRWWGSLFSHDELVLSGVKKMMLLMAVVEVANFPLVVCGGIMRAAAKPKQAMYATLGGFYFVALPLGILLAFKLKFQLAGLVLGFLVGNAITSCVMLVLVGKINWAREDQKAKELTRV